MAVVPAWQGRVMTSTAGGASDSSYGWLNRETFEDIREETVEALPPSREGVLKTAVLGGKITEFLDMDAIIAKADPPFLEHEERQQAED